MVVLSKTVTYPPFAGVVREFISAVPLGALTIATVPSAAKSTDAPKVSTMLTPEIFFVNPHSEFVEFHKGVPVLVPVPVFSKIYAAP